MGFGWDLQSDAMRDYFSHKQLPEIFGPDTLLNVVNFVLGCHPVSNTSYVSRVGGKAGRQIIVDRLCFNRDDFSYIPGGVVSASFMRPEFMDLRTSRIVSTKPNT